MSGPITAFLGTAAPQAFLPMDRRWALITRMIEEKKIDWLSLDVFDTVIFRNVPEPPDLFRIVGHELKNRGALLPGDSPDYFCSLRGQAEVKARHDRFDAKHTAEVDLQQIYAKMPQPRFKIPVADIMRLELETEFRICHPNMDAFAAIRIAQKQGIKIAFVSDTYFDKDFVLSLLRKGLPDLKPDLLLVSQEHGVSKGNQLFQVFLEKTKADPRRVLHVGDNPQADIAGGRKYKIRTFYLCKYTYNIHETLTGEWRNSRTPTSALLDPIEGDFGLTWLRTRMAFYPSALPSHLRPFFDWGATVMGPLLTLFTDWAAERVRELSAESDQAPTLYCMMRDGRMLGKLINLRAPDITTYETWANRTVSLKALLVEGKIKDIEKFLKRDCPATVALACEELGIPLPPDLPPEAIIAGEIAKKFFHFALMPKTQQALKKESRRIRINLFKHLANQGINKKLRRMILIDLGYNATTQRALQRMFDSDFENRVETYGLYLGTYLHGMTEIPSVATEGWLLSGSNPQDLFAFLSRCPEALETACTAFEGAVFAHDDDGNPICSPNLTSDWHQEQITAVQQGILAFARHCPKLPASNPNLIKQLARTLIRSIGLPTSREAVCIGNWPWNNNFEAADFNSLVSYVDPNIFSYMPLNTIARIPNKYLLWPFGLARRHSLQMARRLHALYSGMVDSNIFYADDPDPTRTIILANYGHGFNNKNVTSVILPRTDRGLVYINCAIACPNGAPSAVAIQCSHSLDEVFSFLRISLGSRNAKGEETVIQDLKTVEDFKSLQRINVELIRPNLFRLAEVGGVLLLELPKINLRDDHIIGLRICYSLMHAHALENH